MIVCNCHGTTDQQVRDALLCGARCGDEVGRQCGGAGLACGGCRPLIDALVDASRRNAPHAQTRSAQVYSVA
jgi:bacterioferritin-associated ferredoxin